MSALVRTALRDLARRFIRARQGVAALEFALILPVLVLMFLGMTEITVGVNTDRKLALVTRTLADLTGRESSMSSDVMASIFSAAAVVMQPYSISNGKMVVSSVTVTTSGTTTTGKVAWSCASGSGATARTVGSTYAVPDSFKASASFVLVETLLNYTPMFGSQIIGGTLVLNETTPWPVRNGSQVTWTGSSC